MPLYHDRQVQTARLREGEAARNWRVGERRFDWTVVDVPPHPGWPQRDDKALAYVHETLAAHVFPRGVVAALTAFVQSAHHVRIVQAGVVGIEAASHSVRLDDDGRIGFGKVIVAAGVEAFRLLQPLWAPDGQPLGRPVKGQAALLQADCDPTLPVLFDNGLYVIAHPGGRVAVGSTSEDEFEQPFSTDDRLETLIAAARRAVPALRGASVIERWAGLRPRGVHREPMIGALQHIPDVIALGGGFKTSFGIANRLGAHAIGLVSGNALSQSDLPDIYNLEIYLRRANKNTE
nr:FAD-dependent oxidoreductase [Marinicella sp. W31]MDC2878109.1 FAD-dependent oxidoreductase [Marinicella sp. W31]